MSKKALAILLAALFLLLTAGCSKYPKSGVYLIQDKYDTPLQTPENGLDAASVYASLTYDETFFYGDYNATESDTGNLKKKSDFTVKNLTENEDDLFRLRGDFAELPVKIKAGPYCYMTTDYMQQRWSEHTMLLTFPSEKLFNVYLVCDYAVEGNVLRCTNLCDWSSGERMADDMEFTFRFQGPALELTGNGKTITLWGTYMDDDHPQYSLSGHVAPDSEMLDGDIASLDFHYYSKDSGYLFCTDAAGDNIDQKASASLDREGLFTISIPHDDGSVHTYQYVIFCQGRSGLTLTDGKQTLRYTVNPYYDSVFSLAEFVEMSSEEKEAESTSAQEKVEKLTEEKLALAVEKKDDLMGDLTKAFADGGLSVRINEKTGEMAMDASVLFGGDSAELTAEGKTFLDTFLSTYISIIKQEKYTGFIKKTVIEGHTAPLADSTFESGLPLSEERAEAVRAYCESTDTAGVLQGRLDAVGCSNSKPVKDADGNIDLAACRRVSFRFLIDLEAAAK